MLMPNPFRSIPLTIALILVSGACTGVPRVRGVAGTSPAPQIPWTPPAGQLFPRDTITSARGDLPPDLAERVSHLTLADIVDIGLQRNPETRVAWANARSAAASYGAARGAWFPTIDGDITASRLQTVASQGRAAVRQSLLNPSVTLSYLVLDLGGRSGSIETARQSLMAADFTHNAVIQNVVLQIQLAYFQYVANRSLLDARRTSLREAQENLSATQERRRVGLATVADELQARTAASQAQLALETTEGDVLTTRGALAFALGLPANVPYDVDSTSLNVPVAVLVDSVDALINAAVRERPDLAAARAQVAAAQGRVTQARGARLPSLQLSATGGRTYATSIPDGANSYNIALGLSIPIFAGFSRAYTQQAVAADAEAAAARAESLRSQVVYEVFSAYYALQTATRSVRTADDLVASAQESDEVALARYRAGVGTFLDLLSAQSALADARAQQVQARLNWNVFLAQLARAAGILDARGGSSLRLIPDTSAHPQ
jgi:outer membrane protein TolC